MNRRNTRNDEVMCVICDLWWLWLLVFLLLILTILTRNYWLPLFGFNPPNVANPLSTATLSIATSVTPHVTNPVATAMATEATPASTATNQATPTTGQQLGIGSLAPDFSLPLLGGGEISLKNRGSRPVLLVFFASFDSYSQAEAPRLRQIGERYGDKLLILPIDIAYNDRTEDVNRFVSDYNWTFPIALDETGSIMALYEQNSVPSHIFIDSNGIIVAMEGALTADQLEEHVSALTSQ